MRYHSFLMAALTVAASAVILPSCTPAKKVARYQYLLDNKTEHDNDTQVASHPPRNNQPPGRNTPSGSGSSSQNNTPLIYEHDKKEQENNVVVIRNRPRQNPRYSTNDNESRPTKVLHARDRDLEIQRDTEQVIRTAMSYIGTPYLYGGTSRRGMDCSGLVCLSYKSVDKDLPRTSATQAETGRPVPRNKIQPGHLIFFSTSKGRKINHVGIVTSVDGGDVEFIHASSSRGVRIDKLSHEYWRPRFVKAVAPLEG